MGFNVGETVQAANDPTRIGLIQAIDALHAGLQYYKVFWGGALGTRTVAETDLRSHAELTSALDGLRAGIFGGYGDFQRLITLQRLVRDQPLRNNIYAFNASRTRFFPYQFKPLLKFLDSSRHRLLICDEVGLGKTIEAGLILLELRARQTMKLLLVVCPANLKEKWRQELRQRFGEEFRVMQAQDMRQFFDDYEEAPDRVSLSGIVSLETIRSERIRQRLEELNIAFDLVIVDEAHHLRNFGTSQREAMRSVAEAAQAMVMLTATPIHLGQDNLFSLLNLLDDEDFPDVESAALRFSDNESIVKAQACVDRLPPDLKGASANLAAASRSQWLARVPLLAATRKTIDGILESAVLTGAAPEAISRGTVVALRRDLAEVNLLGHILTRTRKRDVQEHVPERRAVALEIKFTPQEQQFYDTVTALVHREIEKQPENAVLAKWRLNMPQRRMASSVQGMVEFYRTQSQEDEDDLAENSDFDEIPSSAVSAMEASEGELRLRLRAFVTDWSASGPDAKYDRLRQVLYDLESGDRVKKVLVFATFKHTIRYLDRRLRADGIPVVAISGDTPIAERPALIARFRDDASVRVMLSSRVGSEGLDFQFCSTLVNYDLPWNPMEVEQRIGRLDRIGQEEASIAIFNLWTKGTIEERILRRLYERLGIFERSIGELEAILGEMTSTLHSEILKAAALGPEEAELSMEKTARAIEERRVSVDALEKSAARFVGVDSFFDDEVAAIKKHRRYVTGQQLHRFLGEFLRREVPKTRLEYDFVKNEGRLYPDEGLKSFLRDRGRIGECLAIAGAVGANLQVTFDSQVAFGNPRIEFLNVVHPLVVAVAEFYASDPPSAAAQHVLLRTHQLSPGYYFFFVYKLRVKAARAYNSLETVILRSDLEEACSSEKAEEILGEMVEAGETASEAIEIPASLAEGAIQASESIFLDRLSRLRTSEESSNAAFLDQRSVSVRTYYQKNVRKKKELLARALSAGRQERYIRMLRGQVTKLEGEMHGRIGELDRLRTVTQEHNELAAGILEVV